jgi:hypothetical protein
VAADVCKLLGYKHAASAIRDNVLAGQRQECALPTPGDVVPSRKLTLISEAGLYRLREKRSYLSMPSSNDMSLSQADHAVEGAERVCPF